ncbi:hypothetical protein WN48_02112 [Eufriesea mexicana]|nr:hypothetical protein WN48_02112 [Eufriesea mexicana]
MYSAAERNKDESASMADNHARRDFLQLRHSILSPSRSSSDCSWRHVVRNYCIA